ncbi:DNA/RNA non-specific endonuclease [Streptomyces cinereoruber]|uniref:DNA/RNA non-specific endonuclease n=1 Tax=Streptomyces cinereoruber TaxID=67260 RepID=UPI003C2F0836
MDKKNGSRATGMTSCLTKDYVDSHPGSETDTRVFTPPGYRWAQRTAGFLGARPIRENINACHLLADRLTGSGTDPRNLAACARGADAKQLGSRQGDDDMAKHETDIAAAAQAGQDVYYSVTPRYSGRRTVPTGFAIHAQGTNLDGSAGISISTFIPSPLAGRNLGMFNDPATGRQVPTGSMG